MEIWKDIKDYEGLYQVSNLGNVKSLSRKVWCVKNNSFSLLKERILKPTNVKGYNIYGLSKNGFLETKSCHQLVAISFLNHTPCGHKLVVNHKNFIRNDNKVENLEIITQRENANKKQIKSRSKYTGVFYNKSNNKWISKIYINKHHKYLGCFETEVEAFEYYEKALKCVKNNKEVDVKNPLFSSKYKGVSFCKTYKKWVATIRIDGKQKKIGMFKT